jgi:hypothetical protein
VAPQSILRSALQAPLLFGEAKTRTTPVNWRATRLICLSTVVIRSTPPALELKG